VVEDERRLWWRCSDDDERGGGRWADALPCLLFLSIHIADQRNGDLEEVEDENLIDLEPEIIRNDEESEILEKI